MLTSVVHVVEQADGGPLIRIEVRGRWPDGSGDTLAGLVRAAIETHDPFAICIDLCQIRGWLRADTLSGLLPICATRRGDAVRPITLAAKGSTGRAVRWFLDASRVSEVANVVLFSDAPEAVKHLRSRSGSSPV